METIAEERAGVEQRTELGDLERRRRANLRGDHSQRPVEVEQLPVGIVERAGDLAGDPDGLVHRELFLARQPDAKALALHERHDVEDEAVGLARVEHTLRSWRTSWAR
jgi:hypothetical protein